MPNLIFALLMRSCSFSRGSGLDPVVSCRARLAKGLAGKRFAIVIGSNSGNLLDTASLNRKVLKKNNLGTKALEL